MHGFLYGRLEGGADFALGNGFHIAPIVTLDLGQFRRRSADCDDYEGEYCSDRELDSGAVHLWLAFNVRLSYGV